MAQTLRLNTTVASLDLAKKGLIEDVESLAEKLRLKIRAPPCRICVFLSECPEALCHSQLTTNSFAIGTAIINTHTVNEQLCCATPYTPNRKPWCNQGFQDSDKHLN
jgi:hypothetical protein